MELSEDTYSADEGRNLYVPRDPQSDCFAIPDVNSGIAAGLPSHPDGDIRLSYYFGTDIPIEAAGDTVNLFHPGSLFSSLGRKVSSLFGARFVLSGPDGMELSGRQEAFGRGEWVPVGKLDEYAVLFGQAISLSESQRQLFANRAAESSPPEWADEVLEAAKIGVMSFCRAKDLDCSLVGMPEIFLFPDKDDVVLPRYQPSESENTQKLGFYDSKLGILCLGYSDDRLDAKRRFLAVSAVELIHAFAPTFARMDPAGVLELHHGLKSFPIRGEGETWGKVPEEVVVHTLEDRVDPAVEFFTGYGPKVPPYSEEYKLYKRIGADLIRKFSWQEYVQGNEWIYWMLNSRMGPQQAANWQDDVSRLMNPSVAERLFSLVPDHTDYRAVKDLAEEINRITRMY